jgi:hypothetical protein
MFKKKLESLFTAREDGENFKPYYNFLAISSKRLSAHRQTDGRTETAKYVRYMILSTGGKYNDIDIQYYLRVEVGSYFFLQKMEVHRSYFRDLPVPIKANSYP